MFDKSIAVIDDDIDVANLFKVVLEDEGYTAFAFNDPIAALNYIQRNSNEFGIVISDYRMPNLNGYQLGSKLMDLNPKLKVIIISAYEILEDYNPRFAFIHKPISIAKLISVVNEAISKSIYT